MSNFQLKLKREKKLYKENKQIIKQEYKTLIVMALIVVIFNIPVNYTIFTSGGTININDRVKQ